MKPRTRSRGDLEQATLALACRQHGVVTRAQLIDAGMAPDQVDRRLKENRLRSLQKGIYLVGPLVAPFAKAMAAALACGESAVVSHRSAAALWQLLPNSIDADVVDVIIPPDCRRRRPGVRVHRVELHADEVTKLEAIPVTTPTRTLHDLASTTALRDLERAVAEALARGLTSRARLGALLMRYERRAGSNRLSTLMGSPEQPALTRSAAEESFLSLIRKAQLPAPEVNASVQGHEVDFFWRTAGFVAEIDGFAFHASRRRFESDRRRDAVLAASGMRVIRVTWRQIASEPEALLVRLAQALARTG